MESYDLDITINLIFRVLYLNAPSLSVNWLSFVTHFLPVRLQLPVVRLQSCVQLCSEGGRRDGASLSLPIGSLHHF